MDTEEREQEEKEKFMHFLRYTLFPFVFSLRYIHIRMDIWQYSVSKGLAGTGLSTM